MITLEEALSIISRAAGLTGTERVNLADSTGRVLAEDAFSDMDMPPFNKSAVDGYACRRADLGGELQVIEFIPAGRPPQLAIGEGQCSKLMTGGMLPDGADTVLMVEDTEETASGRIRFKAADTAHNICYRAEDITLGALVLPKGTRIRPQEIAVLASVGAHHLLVCRQVRIGVISTGDELVEPDQVPALSQIRNSNAWQLLSQVRNAGAVPSYYGIAPDTEDETLGLIEKAVTENDIVLLTGGISMGDYDFVPAVLANAGFDIRFRKMAVQPGKPSIFATRGGKYVFALPGNPVSSFVQFEILVNHLLEKMQGIMQPKHFVKLPLGADFRRRKADRKGLIPVRLTEEGSVVPVEYHGSAHIHAYIHADAIMSVEIGVKELMKGEAADVRLL